MTFEENLNKLDEIVRQMEKGELSLEKSVELYGDGTKLAALCKEQLQQSQLKITVSD